MAGKSVAAAILMAFLATAPVLAEPLIVESFEGDPGPKITVGQSTEGSVVFKLEGGGKAGRWLSLEFIKGKLAGMAYVYLPVVDRLSDKAADYDGLTFRVKGDGSKTFGLIEMRSDNYESIYQAIFPLTSTDWTEVSVRWDDFLQMNDVGRDTPFNWRGLNKFAFGGRADWGACRYCVDDISLARIPPRAPLCASKGDNGLAKSIKKLRSGGTFTIVALGDSITHGTKVDKDKREMALYFQVAAAELKGAFPAVITTVNAGVGGDTIAEGLVRVGHQVAPARPDLVVVLLGANDAIYDFPESRVRKATSALIDALLVTTSADILILGPTPIADKPGVPERYDELYRKIAEEKRVAYLNLTPAFTILSRDDYQRAYADTVHWSEYGHKVIGQALAEYIRDLAK